MAMCSGSAQKCERICHWLIEKDLTMNTNHTVKRVSPMLVAADIVVTVDFYVQVLGFALTMNSPGYAVVERDGATIHFMKAANEKIMEAVRGHTDIYIEVSDIASLWEHVCQFKGRYRIRDLFDRDYGMREFHIADPNDCLVFVGERIA